MLTWLAWLFRRLFLHTCETLYHRPSSSQTDKVAVIDNQLIAFLHIVATLQQLTSVQDPLPALPSQWCRNLFAIYERTLAKLVLSLFSCEHKENVLVLCTMACMPSTYGPFQLCPTKNTRSSNSRYSLSTTTTWCFTWRCFWRFFLGDKNSHETCCLNAWLIQEQALLVACAMWRSQLGI